MRVIIKQHPGTGLWVSSDGRVILPPCKKYPKFRFTFGHKNYWGYMVVKYHGKNYQVHRLICETFHGPAPEGKPTVDHINRDKTDNRAFENLRWADMKMQNDNKQRVDDSLAKYGVRRCEDKKAYMQALYANNPDYAERDRAKCRARCHEWRDQQKALGRRYRTLPDGSRQWMTDAEYNARFGISQQSPLF